MIATFLKFVSCVRGGHGDYSPRTSKYLVTPLFVYFIWLS